MILQGERASLLALLGNGHVSVLGLTMGAIIPGTLTG